MLVKDKGGYLYPWPEQASAVLEILRMEMRRSGVKTELCADVKRIGNEKGNGLWTVYFGTEKAEHDAVILACGGCAAVSGRSFPRLSS